MDLWKTEQSCFIILGNLRLCCTEGHHGRDAESQPQLLLHVCLAGESDGNLINNVQQPESSEPESHREESYMLWTADPSDD